MRSSINTCRWTVKIIDLPINVTPRDLSNQIQIDVHQIIIPKVQTDLTRWYAIIHHFQSNQEAIHFAWQWNGKIIFDKFQIECLIETNNLISIKHHSDSILNAKDKEAQLNQYKNNDHLNNLHQISSPNTNQLLTQQNRDDFLGSTNDLHSRGFSRKDQLKCDLSIKRNNDHSEEHINMNPNLLKTVTSRMAERESSELSILATRTTFFERLKREKVLVVWGEMGSGISSQLPQYAAECFPGDLVLCTQSSATTAIALARQVANEYDGTSVGHSVGYQLDRNSYTNNHLIGTNIMFMTNGAFIHELQYDANLSRARVLIIDNAHERSLESDIIMGIAKLLLTKRPKDLFLVVIVSDIIDPTEFLNFFERGSNQPLTIVNNEYSVSTENIPPPYDCPNDKLIELHVIPTLFRLYPTYSGHTLVLLPDQRQIEKALRLFSDHLPNGCATFPLYESLSIEEKDKVFQFDDDNSNKRMVIFCTNVPETLISIKNIRLVIDAGFVRQCRFDINHQINIIETVRICRFSAIQRKRYAGRVRRGHCVRLYRDEELKEETIEPEIIRSSLDIIFLQLLRLRFELETFPFMSPPDPASVRMSLSLLTHFKCIDHQKKITLRGQLFAELSINPRLTAIMVNIYTSQQSQQLLPLAAAIVAILSTSASLFAQNEIVHKCNEAITIRMTTDVYDQHSDLFHLYAVLNRWKTVGNIDRITNKCIDCHTSIQCQSHFCQSCRAQHSIINGLNNNILQIINTSTEFYVQTISNSQWKLTPDIKINNEVLKEVDIISEHFRQLFPEQIGHLLVPHLPVEGIRLIQSDLRASIINTSTYVQRVHHYADQYFVAMSIELLPSGKYLVDRLHPVSSKQLSTSPIRKLFTRENIGWSMNNELRNQFDSFRSEAWAKWIVYEYDRISNRLTIWGPETDQSLLQFLREPIIVNVQSKVIECGPIRASFQDGMICLGIESMENTLRLNFQRVPCTSYKQLQVWLQTKLDVTRHDIKENNFQQRATNMNDEDSNDDDDYEAPPFYIVFKSLDAFNKATANLSPQYVCSDQALSLSTTGTHMNEKDAWGRLLVITIPQDCSPITGSQILQRLAPYAVDCRQFGRRIRVSSFGIELKNLPRDATESFLCQIIHPVNPLRISLRQTHKDGTGSSSAYVFFTDDQQCKQAMTILQSDFCQKKINIIVRNSTSQQLVQKQIIPTVNELLAKGSVSPTFLITVNNREEAFKLYKEIIPKMEPTWKIDSSATVTITHPHLYPGFDVFVKQIAAQFETEVQQQPVERGAHKGNGAIRCFFNHGTPQKTALAAGMLAQATSPIIIKMTDHRQRRLFSELFEQGLIQDWSQKLNLQAEKEKSGIWVEIRGPTIQQGQLMRHIGDYSDQFDERFRVLELSSIVANFFGQQTIADIHLQTLTNKWIKQGCNITYVTKTNSIVIYADPQTRRSIIDICETEVKQLLSKISGNDNAIRDKQICVFCGKLSSSTKSFRICGHSYCQCTSSHLMQIFPLRCNEQKCQANIDMKDLLEIFHEREELFRICKKSLQIYLTQNAGTDDRLFCPNNLCDGLIKRSRAYQTCLTCGRDVCALCSLIDDDLHQGRTCAERNTIHKMGDYFPTLFQTAEKFARDNWMPNLSPIIRIDHNMNLVDQCPSLKRFFKGAEALNGSSPPEMSRGFFAFHGTNAEAIKPICTNGFDPGRRKGQACGPGEYFGVSAAISHGYCRTTNPQGARTMIIAFLLQCPQLKSVTGSCHVMNNPLDWSHAFSLPVVVVSYGTQGTCQSPFTS